MKFSIQKSKLSGYLQAVLQVAPQKPALPILSNILMEALDQKLKLSATDLDISITVTIDGNVSKKGVAALPARILHDLIRELPEAEIQFEQSGQRVEVKFPNGSYKISTVSVADYPTLPIINLKKQVQTPTADVVAMIRKAAFAASTDETRPALNGVLWQTKGDQMVMVATDGHRLSRVATPNKALKGAQEDIIISPKALNLVTKFVADAGDEIGVIFGENNVIFNLGDIILATRLIDGPYPNYEQVIPKGNSKSLRVNREELAAAVRRVSILSNSLTHQIKLALSTNKLQLSTTNMDVGGEATEAVACDYTGDALELGYNANYVIEILSRLETKDVIFELESPISAGLVYGADTKKEDFLCLIMPLRLAE